MSPRKRKGSEDSNSSSPDKEKVDPRQSYISRRNKPNNTSMNKGFFIVHKRDDGKSNKKEKSARVSRASTYLANSMIFGKNNLRNSKQIKNKVVEGNGKLYTPYF